MKHEIKPILCGEDVGRTKQCPHGAELYEHCSRCDSGKLHVISLADEELEVMIRALTFASDFQEEYYTLYPGENYMCGDKRKQARGERIMAALRQSLSGDPEALDVAKLPYVH